MKVGTRISWHGKAFKTNLKESRGKYLDMDMADESLSKILEPFHSRNMHT